MSNIKDILFKISNCDSLGSVNSASKEAAKILEKYCTVKTYHNLSVAGFLKGKSDYTIMLDAHIDQIGMVVTNIDDEGFLTVSSVGGVDIRALPSRSVTVHGKHNIPAVFCSTPPHLSTGETEYDDISKIKLDTGLGKDAKDIVTVGDYVTFSATATELYGDLITGRSFDDRSGVACVLAVAEKLSKKDLPCNVAFLLSDSEELGMRGAGIAAFDIEPDEAIAIDVSFGDGIDIPSGEFGKLKDGAMIGIAPVLDRGISNKLTEVAKTNGIKYQTEVMGQRTGTNADVISVSRGGVKTCTLSIPLRNMHTEVETLSLSDLESVCDLLEKYILSGGLKNA